MCFGPVSCRAFFLAHATAGQDGPATAGRMPALRYGMIGSTMRDGRSGEQ